MGHTDHDAFALAAPNADLLKDRPHRRGDADWSGDPVLEAMAARRDELFEPVIETRARSVEGVRAKARLFEAEPVNGFDADAAMVGRSIAADLAA